MARFKRAVAFSIIAGLLGAVLVWAYRPRPIAVETALVTEGLFQAVVEEDGRTRVRERYVVSAPLAGRVMRVSVRPGDAVSAGSRIAIVLPTVPSLLDPRTRKELEEKIGAAEALAEEATARLERARALVQQTEKDVQRVRTLFQRGAATNQQLEREELILRTNERDLIAAERRKHASEHELDQARAWLKRYDEPNGDQRFEITSPVAGRVLRVMQESEIVVSGGTPLVEIGDPADLEIIVDVLTTDAVRIKPGAKVAIQRWGGAEDLHGKVRLVEPGGFTKISALGVEEQRVWVVVELTTPREGWAALGHGYRVEARITTDEITNATVVPASALFRRGQAWAAFVIQEDRANERPVQVLRTSGRLAAVGSGLRPGDRVVVFPPSSLQRGNRVRTR
jgi:HlyD family secretion protein